MCSLSRQEDSGAVPPLQGGARDRHFAKTGSHWPPAHLGVALAVLPLATPLICAWPVGASCMRSRHFFEDSKSSATVLRSGHTLVVSHQVPGFDCALQASQAVVRGAEAGQVQR